MSVNLSSHASATFAARERFSGFSLVELVVTLAVAAIIAAVAMPSFESMLNSSRLRGASEELTSVMLLARSEAVRRNAPVTVCGSSDGTTCNGSTNWARWIVIGRDNAASAGGSEVIDVIRDNALPGGVQLTGPAAGIRFNPSGRTRGQETLTACLPTTKPAENQRVMTVMISGNARTTKADGGGAC